MALSNSGGWVVGDTREDLDTYLRDYAKSNGHTITDVAFPVCEECNGRVFDVEVDDVEGAAVRTCTEGHEAVPMFDANEYLDDADMGNAACPCGNETFEVAGACAVGEDGEVRWVFVGLRCVNDGVLGCYADWKIDYAPSRHLLTAV